MKLQQPLTRNKAIYTRFAKLYHRLKRPLFPILLICLATFFIQAEDDETGMYILLVAVIVIVGAANIVKRMFSKKGRQGKDGHKPDHHQHTHGDNAK
jgi:hypothetical protein